MGIGRIQSWEIRPSRLASKYLIISPISRAVILDDTAAAVKAYLIAAGVPSGLADSAVSRGSEVRGIIIGINTAPIEDI